MECLLYTMKQAPHEKNIIRQCLASRQPLPDSIANAPELELGMELYYDAFLDLSDDREVGLAPGPIPWSVIRDWGLTYELSPEQMDDLFYYVKAMDKAYLQNLPKAKPTGSVGRKKVWSGSKS